MFVNEEPLRGYAVLGAGFDIDADKYASWNHWPNIAKEVFPPYTPQVAACMKNLYMNNSSPHVCRGVGVLVRFLEACEALPGRKSEMR